MTLNGVIAVILHYFTEFDSTGGRLRHSGLTTDPAEYPLPLLAKSDPRSSRTVFPR